MSIDPQLYPWLSLLAVIWGLLDCFCGYRIFKVTILLWGVLAGGLAGWMLGRQINPLGLEPVIGGLMGALIGGGVAFALYLFMVFVTGLAFGFAVAALLLRGHPEWHILILGVVLGLLGGGLALKLQKAVLILATAFLGAIRAVLATMYFTHQVDWTYYLTQRPEQIQALWEQHPWCLPAMLALTIVGVLAQFGSDGTKSSSGNDGKSRK